MLITAILSDNPFEPPPTGPFVPPPVTHFALQPKLPPGPSPCSTDIGAPSKKLPTPINVECLQRDLTGYDPILKTQIIKGFNNGFDLGFRGHANNRTNIANLKSAIQHPEVVDKNISKELKAGRIAGPFKMIPFDKFQLNPIGVVPKKTPGSFRMITNLSSPQGNSINDNISDIFSKVNYASFSEAIKMIIDAGPNAFLAKTDIEHAFRLIPINPNQYHLLCFKWNNSYYFDRCLPMGARSSCQIFELLSSAIQFILLKQGLNHCTHYLDDFLIANSSLSKCQTDLDTLLSTCTQLNIPIANDKTVAPTQVIQYLGIEIDTIRKTVKLPNEKLDKCKTEIRSLLERKKCSLRELQSLLGLLQFACRVIVPGRTFLQNLYGLTMGCSKPYHKIRLSKNTKKDLLIWLKFLEHFNGVSLYKEQLFLDPSVIQIFTDASKSLGAGAVFGNSWFSVAWPSKWWPEQNITFLEFIPIVLALETWGQKLRNSCVQLQTDNIALVFIINKQSSKEMLVKALLRRLMLTALRFNILLQATHIPGYKNYLSDSLSRLQITKFFTLHPTAHKSPSHIEPLPLKMS